MPSIRDLLRQARENKLHPDVQKQAEKDFIEPGQTTAHAQVKLTGLRQRDIERQERKSAREISEDHRHRLQEQLEESLRESGEEEIERRQSLTWAELDESQQAAVNGVLRAQFSCIIGSAGTGKTTVVRFVAEHLRYQYEGIDMAFVSFMGRAAQQLKNALPFQWHHKVTTIHSFLGYHPEEVEVPDPDGPAGTTKWSVRFVPTFNAMNKLDVDVVVVDEAGTVSVDLWNALIAALKPNCKIILMGDINQLPPVNGHSVLGYAMINWPTFELTKIHRQAADNPIISNAHRVLAGKLPTKNGDKRFMMVEVPGTSGTDAYKAVLSVVNKMADQSVFKPLRDVLIVPFNKGPIGKDEFNAYFTPHFNEPQKVGGVVVNKRYQIQAGPASKALAQGDKVMFLVNDHANGITNGMIGVITDITINGDYKHASSAWKDIDPELLQNFDSDEMMAELNDKSLDTVKEERDIEESQRQASHVVTVMFEAAEGNIEKKLSTVGALRNIAHAYAITVHKSQGGEYPVVVILCHSAHQRMLTRELLYTAITRGKQQVVLIYNQRGLTQAVSRQHIRGNTLEEKAKKFIELENANIKDEKRKAQKPNLPMPREVPIESLVEEEEV